MMKRTLTLLMSLALVAVFLLVLSACSDDSGGTTAPCETHEYIDDVCTRCGQVAPSPFRFSLNTDRRSYTLFSVVEPARYMEVPSTYRGLPVVAVGADAFRDLTELGAVRLPETVESIGAGAFRGCTSLQNVWLSDSVTSVGKDAFAGCKALVIYCEADGAGEGWHAAWNSSDCPVVWSTVREIHLLTHHPGTPATCTESGVADTWSCELCDKVFGDARATAELTDSFLPAFGHTMRFVEAVEPTCTEQGNVAHWHCASCKLRFADEAGTETVEDAVIPALGHELTYVDAAAPTCTEAGNVEHWHCDTCGKNYADKGATSEIADVILSALGHGLAFVPAVSATCTEAGNVAYWHCNVCGKDYTNEGATEEIADTVLSALGHELTYVAAVAPTCTEAGNVAHWHCDTCSKNYAAEDAAEEIPDVILPSRHITAERSYLAPTCLEDGINAHWACTVCGLTFADREATVPYPDYVLDEVDHLYEDGACRYCGATEGLAYDREGDTYVVTGIGTATGVSALVIPHKHQGLPVVAIADGAFSGNLTVTSLTVPASVTSIGYEAFKGCVALKTVTLTDRESALSVGGFAFGGCSGLVGVYAAHLSDWCALSFDNDRANPLYYAGGLYVDGVLVTEATLSASVGDWAFVGCASLTAVTLEATVDYVGYEAFAGCDSLTVYAEADSEPASWDPDWNPDGRPVVWGN